MKTLLISQDMYQYMRRSNYINSLIILSKIIKTKCVSFSALQFEKEPTFSTFFYTRNEHENKNLIIVMKVMDELLECY